MRRPLTSPVIIAGRGHIGTSRIAALQRSVLLIPLTFGEGVDGNLICDMACQESSRRGPRFVNPMLKQSQKTKRIWHSCLDYESLPVGQPRLRTRNRGIIGVMTDVTQILSQIESGDPSAAEQLLPLVYEELRKLAAAKLAQEKPGQTLQATALVHEAYLRLVDVEKAQHWDSRGTSFPRPPKRCGGSWWRRRGESRAESTAVDCVELRSMMSKSNLQPRRLDLLALDEALARLAQRTRKS